MCRLFGFRSVIPSQIHRSLISAENALINQSEIHSDGWGVAYYNVGAPHIVKSVSTAIEDRLVKQVSGIVSSQTVLAHLRKATVGENSIVNSHPFQYGPWVFAHNGNIKNFEQVKPDLIAKIDRTMFRFALGDTDSEIIFLFLLSYLQADGLLAGSALNVHDLCASVARATEDLIDIVGPFYPYEEGDPLETYLTFILTNGDCMVAHQGGKQLYYSTHKHECPERHVCPSFAWVCENPVTEGQINHLIFSSEPLQGENIWNPMEPGQLIATDASMELCIPTQRTNEVAQHAGY